MSLALLMFAPTVLVLGAIYAFVRPTPPAFLPLPILAVMGLQIVMYSRWSERREVAITADRLRIQAGNGTLEIAIADLDLAHAQVARLDARPELKPFLRTGGMALPGLTLGWFRSRKMISVFCLLTDRQRVLILPARSGKRVVLLSLKRPDDLLAALRQSSDRSEPGR